MNILAQAREKITNYAEVRLNLLKLGFIERTSNVISFIIFTFLMIFLVLSVLVFLGAGFGYWMGDMLNSRSLGFLCAALLYILIVVIAVLAKNGIINAFSGIFIRVLTNVDTDEEPQDEHEKKGKKVKVE